MIADFQFPISDLDTIARQIGNWQSAIANA
jgi:hypothetical protein